MGVYIKGATIADLQRAGIAGVSLNMSRLVEVPSPHGRLIDEDAIPDRTIRVLMETSKAPTVIERED